MSFVTQTPSVIGVQQREHLVKQLEKVGLNLGLKSEMDTR